MLKFLSIKSFRMKLLLMIWICSTATLFLACGCFIFFEIDQFDKDLTKEMKVISSFIADKSSSAIMFNDPAIAEDALLNAAATEPAIVNAIIYDANGNIVASYESEIQQHEHSGIPELQQNTSFVKDGHLHLFSDIEMYSDRLGVVYIEADRHILYERIKNYAIIVAGIMLVSLLFIAAISFVLQKLISAPIMEMVASTKAIAEEKDYSIRVKKYGEDELGVLVDSFNEMLSQIQGRDSALRESEEGYRTLVGNIPGISYRCSCDKDWSMEFISDEIETLSGYPVSDFIGNSVRSYASIIHPEDKQESDERVMKKIEIKEPYATEYRIIAADSSVRWVYEKGQGIFDEDGELRYLDGVVLDVTDRKQAEGALRQSEEQVRMLLDSTAEAIYGLDLKGNCTFCNSACLEMLGYESVDELLGKNMHDVIHHTRGDGSVYPMEECHIYEAFQIGEGTHVDDEVLWRSDGTSFPAEYWSYPTRYDGEIIGSVVTFLDVTERRQIEDELVESGVRFKELMQQSPIVFELYDLDGLQTDVNKAYETLWGFPASQTVNKFNVLKSKEVEDSGLIVYVKKAYAGEAVAVPEYEFDPSGETEAHGAGRKRWLSTRIFPLKDKAGEVQNIVITHEDITERKKAETEREELMKQLASKNEELQSVVYVASHDLKSPLVNITGFSNELARCCEEIKGVLESGDAIGKDQKDKITSLVDNDIPEALDFISAGTSKSQQLLDGLLQVSRVGTEELDIKTLDMNKLMHNVVDAFAFQIKEDGISVVIDDLPGCMGDGKQINQVFSNIIGNAIKYFEPARKGSIKITAKVYHGEGDYGNESVYCIEDNGVGIHQQHQGKVFELFHRLEPEGSAEGEGLGLTITKRALSRNGGWTWVESEPGVGSKFFVSLPKC